ncbi:MAG: ClbS/DfsB family four-helix bundle protein, partial [Anaerolineae bacterium]|nr:ClbS/DfsB family four-helix bundle protein [Anaerolineae bacterium]
MHEQLDKEKLLDLMRSEFAFAQRTLLLIPENQLDTPGIDGEWSVRDALAHMVAWQRLALDWVSTAQRGEKPIMPAPGYRWSEIDKLNADMHARDKGRAINDLLAE